MSDDVTLSNSGYRSKRTGRSGYAASQRAPAVRRLILFACSLVVVLAGLIGASTFIGHRSQTVPVVVADNRPVRVKPENPGGMQINGAESDVFNGAMDDGHARLAPAEEAPDLKGARGPVAAAAPVPSEAPQPPLLAPSPPARTPAASSSSPAAPAPVATPRPVVVPQTSAAAAVSHAPTAMSPTPRAATVQLAALTSEQAARDQWQQLVRRMPELLSGRQPSFSRAERDGHTFWRLRTAGFLDTAQARTFCEHVRAKGAGCSVADF